MSFMIQSVIQLCVLETTILFHAAAMTLLTKWWLNSSDGQDSLPTPLSFVTINIGGDAPIIIQTDRTQTETHEKISYHSINKTERESRCGGLRQRIMISWSWGNCNWYLQLTRIRIDFTMWWIVEPENCDIVILGQLWQQEIRESSSCAISSCCGSDPWKYTLCLWRWSTQPETKVYLRLWNFSMQQYKYVPYRRVSRIVLDPFKVGFK